MIVYSVVYHQTLSKRLRPPILSKARAGPWRGGAAAPPPPPPESCQEVNTGALIIRIGFLYTVSIRATTGALTIRIGFL